MMLKVYWRIKVYASYDSEWSYLHSWSRLQNSTIKSTLHFEKASFVEKKNTGRLWNSTIKSTLHFEKHTLLKKTHRLIRVELGLEPVIIASQISALPVLVLHLAGITAWIASCTQNNMWDLIVVIGSNIGQISKRLNDRVHPFVLLDWQNDRSKVSKWKCYRKQGMLHLY